MTDHPLLTDEAVEAAADRAWPLDDFSSWSAVARRAIEGFLDAHEADGDRLVSLNAIVALLRDNAFRKYDEFDNARRLVQQKFGGRP